MGIDQNDRRLVKGADEVLPERKVHADFAADRAVDLRQQRGGDMRERHATQERGGGEAGCVADHSTAHRHDRAAAIGTAARTSAS